MAHAAAAAEMLRQKPRMRGVSHFIGFCVSVFAGVALIVLSPPSGVRTGAMVYVASLSLLLGISAAYHRPFWPQHIRRWFRHVDHGAIFVLIAGTGTPVAMSLPSPARESFLTILWIGAAIGVLRAVFWINAPRWLVVAMAIGLGWAALPYVPAAWGAMGSLNVALIAIGGVIYSTGAIVYGLKRPNPLPGIFGYHEVFHAFVIMGALCHFICVARLTAVA
jgi:hemolysin III